MKPFLEHVPVTLNSSFLVRELNVPYFEAPLHFHPFFELTLITESKGKRFIGDHIGEFKPDDLVFIGPGIPHFYRCDNEYYTGNNTYRAKAVIIQFTESFLGSHFFETPEMYRIKNLFDKAMHGISYSSQTTNAIKNKLLAIRYTEGFDKLAQLLNVLHVLSGSEDGELLSRQRIASTNSKENDRMNKVYEYVIANYMHPVSLKTVADILYMNEAAFCRFFRKKNRQTFTSFLNEVRVANACKLLLEDDLNVTQICYKSGFENISNFNKQFKKITNVNPLTYKDQFTRQHPPTTQYLTL